MDGIAKPHEPRFISNNHLNLGVMHFEHVFQDMGVHCHQWEIECMQCWGNSGS